MIAEEKREVKNEKEIKHLHPSVWTELLDFYSPIPSHWLNQFKNFEVKQTSFLDQWMMKILDILDVKITVTAVLT